MKSLRKHKTGISLPCSHLPRMWKSKPLFGGGHRTGLPNSALSAFLSKSACVVVHSHKCCTLLNTQWLLQFSTQYSRSFFWEAITKMPKGTGDQSASMTQIAPSSTLPVWSLWPRSSIQRTDTGESLLWELSKEIKEKMKPSTSCKEFQSPLADNSNCKWWVINTLLL